jgi:hypothetical protein
MKKIIHITTILVLSLTVVLNSNARVIGTSAGAPATPTQPVTPAVKPPTTPQGVADYMAQLSPEEREAAKALLKKTTIENQIEKKKNEIQILLDPKKTKLKIEKIKKEITALSQKLTSTQTDIATLEETDPGMMANIKQAFVNLPTIVKVGGGALLAGAALYGGYHYGPSMVNTARSYIPSLQGIKDWWYGTTPLNEKKNNEQITNQDEIAQKRNAWLEGAADIGFSGATSENMNTSKQEKESAKGWLSTIGKKMGFIKPSLDEQLQQQDELLLEKIRDEQIIQQEELMTQKLLQENAQHAKKLVQESKEIEKSFNNQYQQEPVSQTTPNVIQKTKDWWSATKKQNEQNDKIPQKRNAWLEGAADIGFSGATLEKRDVSERERKLLTTSPQWLTETIPVIKQKASDAYQLHQDKAQAKDMNISLERFYELRKLVEEDKLKEQQNKGN